MIGKIQGYAGTSFKGLEIARDNNTTTLLTSIGARNVDKFESALEQLDKSEVDILLSADVDDKSRNWFFTFSFKTEQGVKKETTHKFDWQEDLVKTFTGIASLVEKAAKEVDRELDEKQKALEIIDKYRYC